MQGQRSTLSSRRSGREKERYPCIDPCTRGGKCRSKRVGAAGRVVSPLSLSLSRSNFRSRTVRESRSKNQPRFRVERDERGIGKTGGGVSVKKHRYRAVNASDQAWWMAGQAAAELPFASPLPSTLGASCASAFYPRGLRVIRARAERSAGEFAAAECAPIPWFRSQI